MSVNHAEVVARASGGSGLAKAGWRLVFRHDGGVEYLLSGPVAT